MGERIVTGEEMKLLDKQAIEEHGMPSMVLMERAALAAVGVLRDEGFDLSRVVAVCGPGNNGGDGIAVARLLRLAGHNVKIVFVGDPAKRSDETRRQQEIAESYGLCLSYTDEAFGENEAADPEGFPTTIIDAVFGIGGGRASGGVFLEAIRYINACRGHGGKTLAIDIPSGVCADTGAAPGEAVFADVTVTFAYKKAGLTQPPGLGLAGKIIVADIGIY